ncbi:MAG TPA: type II secretion system protein [Candidatus Saccharimonadales bacterium]|nr:type II secretion system protein [Candidatus Saccharimonadales bacterium]
MRRAEPGTGADRREARGTTLIELIMVIVILGVVAAGVATGFRAATDMATSQTTLASEAAESRRLTGTLGQELRMVVAGGFLTWAARDCNFRTVRGDTVRFTWSGTPGDPLLARYNSQVDTLSRRVDSLAFAYLDTVRATATSAAGIENVTAYVRLSLGGGALAQRILVHVRN